MTFADLGFVEAQVIPQEAIDELKKKLIEYKVRINFEDGKHLTVQTYIDTDFGTKEEQIDEISSVEYWENEMNSIDNTRKHGAVTSIKITWL